ncbi:MAG: hypothetical protein U0269_19650 [Polyangiales bacterium]
MLVNPAMASAQSRTPAERAFELRVAGQIDEALRLMEDAYRTDPSPSNAAQLAALYQAHGDWVEAEEHYQRALAASSDPWVAAHRAELNRALVEVAAELATLWIDCDQEGAILRINGQVRARRAFGVPLRVRAGELVFSVDAPGRVAVQRTLRVMPGSTYREPIRLVPAIAAREAIPIRMNLSTQQSTEARFDVRSSLGLSLIVTGGIVLGTSVVAFVLREDAAVRYNRTGCPPPTFASLSSDCAGLAAAEGTWGALRWAFLGVGAGLIASGTGLMIWASHSLPMRRTARACGLSLDPTGGFAQCEWMF